MQIRNRQFFRPSEIRYSRGNANKAEQKLGWSARTRFDQLVASLCGS